MQPRGKFTYRLSLSDQLNFHKSLNHPKRLIKLCSLRFADLKQKCLQNKTKFDCNLLYNCSVLGGGGGGGGYILNI